MIELRTADAKEAYQLLGYYRKYLKRRELTTLKGQIKAGDISGAMNGLDKILRRKGV